MQNLLKLPVQDLTDDELAQVCVYANKQYRAGEPVMSDETFDLVYMPALEARIPNHPLLNAPQPEQVLASKGRVHHKEPMLSTDKAYEVEDVEAYVARCEAAALTVGVDPKSLQYRLTAKLDGIAGRYVAKGNQLITRGDGNFGNDISHLFDKGLTVIGDSSYNGVGEVVMPFDYFKENLADHFSHPRNLIAGMAGSDNLNEHSVKAMADGAVHLVLYRDMKAHVVNATTLVAELDYLVKEIKDSSPYPLDGTVIELVDEKVKAKMGKNSHHHNWQIAKKEVGETAQVKVTNIRWQVGRTGAVTPVIEIEPTELSGATISNVTGHHAAYIRDRGVGIGAVIEIVRSGEVIPTYRKTVEPVVPAMIAECPCCSHELEWESDQLVCPNSACSAQAETSIMHHFKTIQCDLFGPKTCERLVEAGYTTIEQIYTMDEDALMAIGFGPGQAKNLVNEMKRVIREPLRDNLLLASLGISSLGRGSSEKLLTVYRIEEVSSVTSEQLEMIRGFGDITSVSIPTDLRERADTLKFLLGLGFNLQHTQDAQQPAAGGSLEGIAIVFTGKMLMGNRDDMKADAKAKGAKVQGGVNGKTNILVCGEGVGQKKLDAAKEKGGKVEIITEAEYFERFGA